MAKTVFRPTEITKSEEKVMLQDFQHGRRG